MRARTSLSRAVSVFLIAVIMLSGQAFDAYAQGRPGPDAGHRPDPRPRPYYTPHYAPHGRQTHDLPGGYARMIIGGLEYFYWEGMFYRMAANRYTVVQAPVGAVVTAIPQGSQPVVIDGVPYYNINGVTYMYTSNGYQVVPQPKTIIINNYTTEGRTPAAIASTQGAYTSGSEGSFVVNIPNSTGGYTPLTLKKSGNGFIGPQGEYYAEFPKVEQLKVMYAK